MEFLHPAMWHDHDIDFARWIDTIALNCLVFEKITFFCILATDRETNRWTETVSIDALSRSRCHERRFNKLSSISIKCSVQTIYTAIVVNCKHNRISCIHVQLQQWILRLCKTIKTQRAYDSKPAATHTNHETILLCIQNEIINYKCVSKMHINKRRVAVKTMCNNLATFAGVTFPSLIVCLYLFTIDY